MEERRSWTDKQKHKWRYRQVKGSREWRTSNVDVIQLLSPNGSIWAQETQDKIPTLEWRLCFARFFVERSCPNIWEKGWMTKDCSGGFVTPLHSRKQFRSKLCLRFVEISFVLVFVSCCQPRIDWCCFYYFVRNSLLALLEALCANSSPATGVFFWLQSEALEVL